MIIPSITIVVNIRHSDYDVFIGRPSIWGNPFVIGPDGDRATVIAKYRAYVLENVDMLVELESLRGKRLGCYCYPLPCHGDVLVELLEE